MACNCALGTTVGQKLGPSVGGAVGTCDGVNVGGSVGLHRNKHQFAVQLLQDPQYWRTHLRVGLSDGRNVGSAVTNGTVAREYSPFGHRAWRRLTAPACWLCA